MVFLTDRIINGMRTHLLQCSTDKNDCRSCLISLSHSCGTGALWWLNIELCIDDWVEITSFQLVICVHAIFLAFLLLQVLSAASWLINMGVDL